MFQSEFQPEQYPEESITERDERIARWNDNAAGFIQGQIDKQAERIAELEKELEVERDLHAHFARNANKWMEAYHHERRLRFDGERERDEARRRIAELGQIVEELRFEKEVG